MKCNSIKCWASVLVLAVGSGLSSPEIQASVVNFQDLPLASGSQWCGVDSSWEVGYNSAGSSTSFRSGVASFNNFHRTYYADSDSTQVTHYWDGWAYSNRTDTATTGTAGQFTAMASSASGTIHGNYAVAYYASWGDSVPTITLDTATRVGSVSITNVAYAYSSMLEGDGWAKKFGTTTTTSDDNDWFLLTITGKNAAGVKTGEVNFYLADFRNLNGVADYIISDWTTVDLNALGIVSSIEFTLTSSDDSGSGMNTPSCFALDDLTIVPEPSTLALAVVAGVLAWAYRRRKKNVR